MQYANLAWAWISTHPAQSIIYGWMIYNVIWAQFPQPKNPIAAKLWNFSHAFLQLIVTQADKPGTFTLPWLIKAAVSLISGTSVVSPTAPVLAGPTPPVDPSSTPSTRKTTAKNEGDDHGTSGSK